MRKKLQSDSSREVRQLCPWQRRSSYFDILLIGRQPTPGAGAITALDDPLLVNLTNDIAIAGQQCLGRAHLGAHRQLAFAEAIGAVFRIFLGATRRLRTATTGAVGALVHLAAGAEVADPRILRRPKRTGVEAIAAADALVLIVQYDAVFGREDAFDRTDCRARRVGAMHTGHRHRTLAGFAVIYRNDASAIDAPWHLVLVLAGGNASIATDAALRVAKKFHSSHRPASFTRALSGRAWPSVPASRSPDRSRRSSASSRSRRVRSDRRPLDTCCADRRPGTSRQNDTASTRRLCRPALSPAPSCALLSCSPHPKPRPNHRP